MKITIVVGARPNFVKVAPIIRAIQENNLKKIKQINYRLVHTGQHYDEKLSKIFFQELGLPEPDINLGVKSGSQAEQTARILVEFEKDLIGNHADLVVVVGDVTSTMACTIVAKKLNIRVAHVEGGIRSNDMTMPEEINRIVTDSLADYFFTTTLHAGNNLRKTGVDEGRIFFVGNTMIDSLYFSMDKLKRPVVLDQLSICKKGYYVLTLHRPSNVDDEKELREILKSIDDHAVGKPVIFPVHPRTMKNLSSFSSELVNIKIIEPLSYFEFIFLIRESSGVITDSGGVQEETTMLGIPCVTLRMNTERPETISVGTNELVGKNLNILREALAKIEQGTWKKGSRPDLWDGNTSKRIVEIFLRL